MKHLIQIKTIDQEATGKFPLKKQVYLVDKNPTKEQLKLFLLGAGELKTYKIL